MRAQTQDNSAQLEEIGAIAPRLGCTPETLQRWLRETEEKRPIPPEEDLHRVLERENGELRRANEIIGKAYAFLRHRDTPSGGSTATYGDVRLSAIAIVKNMESSRSAGCWIYLRRATMRPNRGTAIRHASRPSAAGVAVAGEDTDDPCRSFRGLLRAEDVALAGA